MGKHVFRTIAASVFCLCVLAITPMLAKANESTTEEDPWQFIPKIYLWGLGLDATTKVGKDVTVGFDDLLDTLNFGIMGVFEVRKSKWFAHVDLIYSDLSTDKQATISGPIGPRGRGNLNVGVNADLDMTQWIVTLTGGRNVWESEALSVDLFAGARYLDLDSETKVKLDAKLAIDTRFKTFVRGGTREATVSVSENLWDGIVGIKGKVTLYKNWYMPFYADVGTGESDITWQAAGGLGYDFDGINVVLIYRHLSWHANDKMITDLSYSGPMLGAAFHF